jgi:hypothetical protein
MIAVVAPAVHPGSTVNDKENKLDSNELDGQGATLARSRKITFGKSYGVQFYCDTITKQYAYEVARTNAKKCNGPISTQKKQCGISDSHG